MIEMVTKRVAVKYKKSSDDGSCTNNTKSKCKPKEINLSTICFKV